MPQLDQPPGRRGVGALPYSDISAEDQEGVRVVRLNRPESLNSLRRKTVEELEEALAAFARSPGLRALVLTGAGERAFSAGGDIKEMERMGYREARAFASLAHRVVGLIEGTPKPVVSAVNGLALGAGCDLAMACDLCVASEGAKFGVPSLRVGVITPFGGMSRLALKVGLSQAKSLIYTRRLVGAQEAKSLGFVDSVFPDRGLLHGALATVQTVLDGAPAAFAEGKRLLLENFRSREADAREIERYARCFKTEDQKEGAVAFRMKRKPVFRGA